MAQSDPRAIRPPAVAGIFYPADPGTLARRVDELLEGARSDAPTPGPKAVVAPHAGYRYSGPIAASAFATLSREV
ncbi:MAG: AmmeMemoRadiSam system protein B, partial [Thermoanaerobaculia bacterium]|nr:AmmeMemoRadiSam system protein B [Thermoanaerobaculia bacterium]